LSVSIAILIALGFLILFGVLQRVLDRMGLSDRMAILFVGAMIVGSLIPDIAVGDHFAFSIGGGLIPLALCVYLFFKAGTGREKLRAVVAAIVGGAAVFALGQWLPAEPERQWFPDLWLYGLTAGVLACILGRSRRSAFIAGVMGVLLADLAQGIISLSQGYDVVVNLGGAGILDTTLVSGVIAVALSETFGEIRERLQGGTKQKDLHYHDGHFTREGGKEHEAKT